ncbi:tail fiber domain-containing protein [Kluyvera cryocrescens]
MSAGTLTLANNSDVVSGIDTSFTTELAAGDFIVATLGGVTYTLPVKTINSDTDLKLARNYNGSGISGIAWTAMPRDTLNRISAQMAADTAYIIGQRVLEVENWYQLLEVNGDVVIKMADGSSYTGPSWLKLIDVMKAMQIDELIPIAEQIRADAQQVAEDKPVIIQAKDDAQAAAAAAAESENNAATSEKNAAASKGTAAQKAEEAAESARQAAESNPLLALQKSLNLSDLADRAAAWLNVRPIGATPLAADPEGDLDAVTRKFMANAIATAYDTVPLAVTKGGTGATTASAARTALGVGYGTTAGTVAQGNDSRLSSLDGKTGGEVKGAVFTLGDGQIVRSKKNADGSWPTTTPAHAVLLDGRVPNAGQPGGWFGMNMTENVGVDCYGSLYLQAAGVNKTWLFAQNGNAISPGSWVPNSDGRLKRKKERIEDPLGKMIRLGGYTWMRIDTDSWGIGFISQEIADVFPEAISIGPDRELPDGSVVEGVQSPDTYGVAAALHHESILQLMDIVKEAISTIAGVTTDKSAKAALEALAERIPAPDTQ